MQIGEYRALGWHLCLIAPGSKRPVGDEWQKKSIEAVPEGHGVGLIHRHSGTCAIDLDHLEHARMCLEALGVDMDEMLRDGVQIISREGRGKLLYRAPPDLPQKRHNLYWHSEDDPTGEKYRAALARKKAGDESAAEELRRLRYCVIEFRAGDVQDVLPPTIHPDTGHPYQWGGDYTNLPELPETLCKAWKEWPLAKAAMEDACPWAPERPVKAPPKPRSAPRDGASAIDAFNAGHEPGMILEANGYRRAGKRWLAPSSSTMIPGVVPLPDSAPPRVYSHHGSDPLADGYSHDAFSVYTTLEHDGDMTSAVKEAAAIMGLDSPPDDDTPDAAEMGRVISMVPPTPDRVDPARPGPIPSDELAALHRWIASQVPANKPDAITQAVASFACAMTGRRYETAEGQPTAIFCGVTDSSVAGIRPIREALQDAAIACGERRMMRGQRMSSSVSAMKHLMRCPRMYWVTDEYGHMVHMSRVQQSGALESVIGAIHSAYAGKRLLVDPDIDHGKGGKAEPEELDIMSPSVSLMTLMSEDQLSSLSRRSEYGRGTLQQMMMVPAGDSLDGHQTDYRAEFPEAIQSVVSGLADGKTRYGAQESHTVEPASVSVPWGDGVADIVSEAHQAMADYMEADELAQFRGMVHGYRQTAIRLMTALAAWRSPDAPVVDTESARWACDWALYCLSRTAPLLAVSGQGGDPDTVDLVQRILIDAGSAGATIREIRRRCRAMRKMDKQQNEEVMSSMVADGTAVARKSGRSVRYYDARHAPVDSATSTG